VALLLDKGADVTPTTTNGRTVLHVAAQQGHHEIVVMLLMQGADKSAKDDKGIRPVDRARAKGHTTLIALLEP
jgi:ankyrin repeat protein